jgi:hypothetical protein
VRREARARQMMAVAMAALVAIPTSVMLGRWLVSP